MWLKFEDLILCGLDVINFWIGIARNLTYDSRTVALDLKKRTLFSIYLEWFSVQIELKFGVDVHYWVVSVW